MAEWAWQNPSDAAEIGRVLETGDRAALQEIALIIDGFPHGKDDMPSGRYWITNAIDFGAKASIEWMIEKGVNLRFEDDEGSTPLHSCIDRAKPDRYEILKSLIDAGADVNAYGMHNWTPLHLAAIRDDQRMMKMLMEAGADREKRTVIDNYATPSKEARILGHHASADFIDRYENQ